MKRHRLIVTLPFLLVGCSPLARQAAEEDAQVLPLRAVRLYETGIGYFERAGVLSAKPTVLPVPAGHLDDALKTLLVLSKDPKVRVSGVEFSSSVSPGMGRALAGLAQDEPVDLLHLLSTLRGSPLEVKLGGRLTTGRLVDVQDEAEPPNPKAKNDPPQTKTHKKLLLLTDRGELLRMPLEQVESVRPLDPTFSQRLRTALTATSSPGHSTERFLRLQSRDGGPVQIGYLAEAPLWRVSYRVVVADQNKSGVLQGWALIHNDTSEDWRGVQVHLLSGRPDSFLFPLAAPRYTKRPLVTPENELSTVPQLLSESPDKLWGDHVGDGYGSGGMGLAGVGMGGGGSGEGTIGLGRIGTVGHGSGSGSTGTSSLLSVGQLAPVTSASGMESGALFAYSLGEPLQLRAHGSALLPFVQETLEAEQITWVSSPGETARSGLRLQNTTRQTLPEGTAAVFGEAGLLGETVLPRLKPGEQRIVEYGFELDVEIQQLKHTQKEDTQRLAFADNQLEEHFVKRHDQVLLLQNRALQKRTLYLPLKLSENAQVQGADRLDQSAGPKGPVAVFELAPQTRQERPLTTLEGLVRRTNLSHLQSTRLSQLALLPAVPVGERTMVQEAAARQKELEEAGKESEKLRAEIKKAEKDLERLREHLKALGSSNTASAEGNPLVRRILEAEDRLSAAQKRLEAQDGDLERRRELVRKALERLPKGK